jgi:hypothetical protein
MDRAHPGPPRIESTRVANLIRSPCQGDGVSLLPSHGQ